MKKVDRDAVLTFATANDGLNSVRSEAHGLSFEGDPGKTVQSSKDDADINVLMKRFGLNGVMPAARRLPEFGDFSMVSDYQSALNELLKLDTAFAELPAATRARFANDPGELLRFVSDDANYDEAEKLGLLKPKEPEAAPIRVVVDNPAPPPPLA